MILSGRRVLLGVSGGIASYKACTIARRLTEAGMSVDVVLTASAAEFVRPLTFEALTGRHVLTSLWERGQALAHIHLADQPDLIVIAPATANLLARAAQGIADDLLTAILLATPAPVLAAPAMNDEMYASPATRENIRVLRSRGWTLIGPAVGSLAEGPSEQPGRMVEPEEILTLVERLVRGRDSPWQERGVLVTAGPTREMLDPVRAITNASSGRMGFALAPAAYARGADVTLVAGPTALVPPIGVDTMRVVSTAEMRDAVRTKLPQADVLFMAAAPADFAAAKPVTVKRPRENGAITVEFEPTQDVLVETLEDRKQGALIVGFALEVGDGVDRARQKLEKKWLDLVVLNRVDEPGSGFESETNRVTLVTASEEVALERMPKGDVAERILDAVERLL